MHLLKLSTAASVIVGPVLDSTGGAYTGAAITDFNLTKNGLSAALAAPATATHDHNGHYNIALTSGNTDTLGRVAISCNKSTYAMSQSKFEVLSAATFDAIVTNAAGTANGMTLSLAGGKVPATLAAGDVTGNLPVDVQTIKTQTVTCSAAVTVNTNVGTTEPVSFTGTAGSALVKSDAVDWGGTAVGSAIVTANTTRLAGQTVTAAAGVTFPSSIASPTNITAGTITTATNLTNLPSIPTNWLTAPGIAAGALNGKGDWLVSSSYPANFGTLSIDTSGRVLLQPTQTGVTISSVTTVGSVTSTVSATVPGSVTVGGYATGEDPATLLLVTPANKLATDASGRVLLQPTQSGVTIPTVTAVTTANLNLSQAVPTSNTAQTVGDALNAARAQGFGKWQLVGTTLTLYAPDGTTAVRSFSLDSVSAPTIRT